MNSFEWINWAFQALAIGAAGIAISEIRRTRDSIEKLNINVAVVITKTDNHEQRITRLEGE